MKPVILCCLTRRYNGANLDIQFEENKHVMLTVQGPGKVHLIGHYLYVHSIHCIYELIVLILFELQTIICMCFICQ